MLEAILYIVSIFVFFWVLRKFLGWVPGYIAPDDTDYREQIRREDPYIVEEAMERCRKKFYKLTAYNVCAEIDKINGERPDKSKIIVDAVSHLIKKGKEKINHKGKVDIKKLQKLELISKLYQNGIISEEEFEEYKKKIFHE